MYYNFIITNTKKYDLQESDVLTVGKNCININNKLINEIQNKIQSDKQNSDKNSVILKRLQRIQRMISHCQNDIIMTKFVNSIWQKYSFFSDLGEKFLSIEEMKTFFEYLEEEELVTERTLVKINSNNEEEEDEDEDEIGVD